MSSPDKAPENGADRRRSLGKYVKRMSSVFRREKSTTQASGSSTAAPAAPVASTPTEKSEPQPATTATKAPVASTPSADNTTQTLNRSALQQERAMALFAKYGLTLESHEWIVSTGQPTNVLRVEKPIRMRVHRSCHRCATPYGANKICSGCEHKRCKKCPRYPKKKSDKGKESEAAAKPKKKRLLTVTSKTGSELVYQHARQRVRRTCHKCETMFIPPAATICENCRHTRCTKCPRDPAKPKKWPNGYPGDVEPDEETDLEEDIARARRTWRKQRQRVRWECEECNSLFIEGSAQCPGCGHERCEKCKRTPLKKTKKEPQFDPEVVRIVEAKLRALTVHRDLLAPDEGSS